MAHLPHGRPLPGKLLIVEVDGSGKNMEFDLLNLRGARRAHCGTGAACLWLPCRFVVELRHWYKGCQ